MVGKGRDSNNRYFAKSTKGLNLEREIQSKDVYGPRLLLFPRKFVAKVYVNGYIRNNSIEFWEEMEKEYLFTLWDPKLGPWRWMEDKAKDQRVVQMFRVYKIGQDLRGHVKLKSEAGHPLRFLEWVGDSQQVKASSVLSDDQMKEQCDKFVKILGKYGKIILY